MVYCKMVKLWFKNKVPEANIMQWNADKVAYPSVMDMVKCPNAKKSSR